MLLNNGSAIQARFLAGDLAQLARLQGLAGRQRYGNAMAFGRDTSWPQGYQSVRRAMVPPLRSDSGQIAVRLGLDLDLTADLRATGNAEASFAVEVDMTADALMRSNVAVAFAVDLDLTASLRAAGNMAARFDLVGRPSAVDIAQEVWNGFVVESGLSGAEVLRVLLAVAAGKTNIAAGPPVVVTFRDQADTKNRVRAEMDGSERDAVTIDGGA